jgi:mono/diheme cytochrome c family protein
MKMPFAFALACALAAMSAACRRDMAQQAHYKPLQAASFFENGMASRPLPEHTIARGQLRADTLFFSGKDGGQAVDYFPEPVTHATLERGRERYDIFCAVCHGATGNSDGMIVRRGFPAPPSLHLDRVRTAPVGHYYDVITHGFGVMYPYAARVEPPDRWAIAAYIRALQLSQRATLDDAEPEQRARLEALPR